MLRSQSLMARWAAFRFRIVSSLFLAKLSPVTSPKRAIMIRIITTPTSLRKRRAETWLSAPGLCPSLVPWYPDQSYRPCPSSSLPGGNKAADVSSRLQGSVHLVLRMVWLFIHSFVRMPGPWRAGLSYWALKLCLGMLLNRTLGNYLTALHVHTLALWSQRNKTWRVEVSRACDFSFIFRKGFMWYACPCSNVFLLNTYMAFI